MSAFSRHAPHNPPQLGSIWSSIPSHQLATPPPPHQVSHEQVPPIHNVGVGTWDGQNDMQAVVHDLNQEREMVDVEMVDVSELAFDDEMMDGSAMQGDGHIFLALDTNVFISHLSTIKSLHSHLLTSSPQIRLLIPNTVISELDRHKNRYSSNEQLTLPANPGGTSAESIHNPENSIGRRHRCGRRVALGTVARESVEWLLGVGRNQRADGVGMPVARFQKWDEMESMNRLPKADDRILDCCQYFSLSGTTRVFLWTDDRNLALQAEANRIPSFGNKDFSVEEILSILSRNDAAADRSESWSSSTSDRTANTSRNPSRKPSVSPEWATQTNLLDDSVAVLQDSNRRGQSMPQQIPHVPPRVRRRSNSIKVRRPDQRSIIDQNPALQAFLITPDVNTLLLALEEAIALPIYTTLLYLVADGDPVKLRLSVIGKNDPGPNGWTFMRCCELMIQHWDAFILLYGASTSEHPASHILDIDMTDISNESHAHQLHLHQSTASHDLTTSNATSNPDQLSPEQWLASLKTQHPSRYAASNIAAAEHGLQHLWRIANSHSHFQNLPPLNDKEMNSMTTSAISFLFLGPRHASSGPSGWWLDDENRICIETIIRQLSMLSNVS